VLVLKHGANFTEEEDTAGAVDKFVEELVALGFELVERNMAPLRCFVRPHCGARRRWCRVQA
jgi:hypothetical protein